jgi:hypothetical protein
MVSNISLDSSLVLFKCRVSRLSAAFAAIASIGMPQGIRGRPFSRIPYFHETNAARRSRPDRPTSGPLSIEIMRRFRKSSLVIYTPLTVH